MSRSTQYIGLNSRAWEFLGASNATTKKLTDYVGDTGMFSEPLHYGIYEVTIKSTDGYEVETIETYAEVTQCEIWYGGPMYFTCLKNIKNGQLIGEWADEEMDC